MGVNATFEGEPDESARSAVAGVAGGHEHDHAEDDARNGSPSHPILVQEHARHRYAGHPDGRPHGNTTPTLRCREDTVMARMETVQATMDRDTSRTSRPVEPGVPHYSASSR